MKSKSLFCALLALAFCTSAWAQKDHEYKLPPFKAEMVGEGVTKVLSEIPTNAVTQHGFDKLHERGITGKGIEVGINDTGLRKNHPDLKDRIVSQSDSTADRGAILNDHGGHVSGIVAASKNGVGTYGCQYDTKLHDLKCLGGQDGTGNTTQIVSQLDNGTKKKLRGMNMSMGGPYDKAIVDAIDRYYVAVPNGAVFVASGNDGTTGAVNWPGRHKPVFTCASVGPVNTRSKFSNAGPEVDGAAVGENVIGPWGESSMARIAGTSMSTPALFAGWIAYCQRCDELKRVSKQSEFEELFALTALRAGANRTDALGWGVLQADKLIDALDAKDAKEKAGSTPPPMAGAEVRIQWRDLTPAAQKRLTDFGVTTVDILIGGAFWSPPKPTTAPANTPPEGLAPMPGFTWRTLPGVGPGWVQDGIQFGPDAVPLTAPVPSTMPTPSCPPSGCPQPTQSTRSLLQFPWVRR